MRRRKVASASETTFPHRTSTNPLDRFVLERIPRVLQFVNIDIYCELKIQKWSVMEKPDWMVGFADGSTDRNCQRNKTLQRPAYYKTYDVRIEK